MLHNVDLENLRYLRYACMEFGFRQVMWISIRGIDAESFSPSELRNHRSSFFSDISVIREMCENRDLPTNHWIGTFVFPGPAGSVGCSNA